MFFTFKQNNNRGKYQSIYKYVIVEADSAEEANNHKDIQWCVYFDKRYDDCDCCGPRWIKVTDEDATEVPMINGLDVTDPAESLRIDGNFFIQFKDKVVKDSPDGFIDQYVSADAKTVATTEEEKAHEKKHAKKGQGGRDGEDGDSKDSSDDEVIDVLKKVQEQQKEEQEKKQQEIKNLSDKELKDLQKQLKEQKGWYEQKWD
jgi:gas vesicle protein